MKKNLRKIKKNPDLKQKGISGVRELKDFLYSKRGTLTQEEIETMVNITIESVMEYTYELAWQHRNDIYECRRDHLFTRLQKAWSDFYSRNVGKVPVKVMEEMYYIYDIAMQNRYFNEDLPLTRQIDNRIIF